MKSDISERDIGVNRTEFRGVGDPSDSECCFSVLVPVALIQDEIIRLGRNTRRALRLGYSSFSGHKVYSLEKKGTVLFDVLMQGVFALAPGFK
ncbi:hypothetical protein HMPREF3227_00890 [Corynebacterium sp. CMW7794]|nr:hypothetical protein HMPREF0307_02320 [Corynebacterium sp. DNF00584]KXI18750.1 hypothetical protein HMPREF3227_00890 [Corynebacterium sp. CMW7794]